MALNLNDAKMYCAEKGRQFVIYFEMIYDSIMNGSDLDDFRLCFYVSDMQEMVNHINEIRLRHKYDKLTIFQKLNWFYSYCEYYEDTFLQDVLKIEAYEQFINEIEINRKSVYDAVKEVFDLKESFDERFKVNPVEYLKQKNDNLEGNSDND